MPGQLLGVGGRYSHSVQLCVPFRMALVLRAGVEVGDALAEADADEDILGGPRTMIKMLGWIAHQVTTVRGRLDADRGERVVVCRG